MITLFGAEKCASSTLFCTCQCKNRNLSLSMQLRRASNEDFTFPLDSITRKSRSILCTYQLVHAEYSGLYHDRKDDFRRIYFTVMRK